MSRRIYAKIDNVIVEMVNGLVLIGVEKDGELPSQETMERLSPQKTRLLSDYLLDAAGRVELSEPRRD